MDTIGRYGQPPPSASPLGGAVRPDAVMPGGGGSMIDLLMGATQDFAPKYPSWLYTTNKETGERELAPPPTPKADRFKDWIQADVLAYGDLLGRFRDDLMMYRRLGVAVSPQFAPDIDAPYVSDEAAIQINKVAAMIAGTPHTVNYTWRSTKEQKQAQAMEAFDLWFLEQWDAIHRAEGNSELKWDLIWSALIYGRQVVQVSCDLEDGDFPWMVKVHDPATVFPMWGKAKQGLIRVSVQLTASIADILSEFDPRDEKGIADKLSAKAKRQDRNAIDYDMEMTYTECWTPWSRYAAADDIELERVDHEYGETGFIYNLATGEMGGAATPQMGRRTGLTRRQIEAGYGRDSTASRRRDHVEKGVSFLHAIKNALRNRERFLGMHATAAEQGINPAYFLENPYTRMPEPFDFGPGGRNELRPGQRPTPVVNSPRPNDSNILIGAAATEIAKGMLPDIIFGQSGDSNISGFQSDTLMNAAADVIQPYRKLTENTLADVLALKSRLYRNHGHLAEGLIDGQLRIPAQRSTGSLAGNGKPAEIPPWAAPIMQMMMQYMQTQVSAMQPPPPPAPELPGGPGMIGSDVPGAPPRTGTAPPLGGGMGMGMGGGVSLGMPGYANPAWAMSGMPEDDPPEFVVDIATIDAISTRPKVVLTMLGLQNRTVLANYLDLLTKSGLMDPSTAMEQIPEIQDVVAEQRKILATQARMNPDALKLVEYPKALWESGDMASFFIYYASILMPQMMGGMMGQGPPPGAGGETAGPPSSAPGPGPQMVQGDSAAMMGRGPGSQGGAVGRPY